MRRAIRSLSAGVDFLGSLTYVDRGRIGAIGICGSGGFVLNATSVDPRIRAVATSALVDISRLERSGFMDSKSEDDRRKALQDIADSAGQTSTLASRP
jgi:uncharacterized protein